MSVIIGHRGAARLAPENTLPGFRRALEAGVDGIELDVRLTRDGVPVCFHDDRPGRLTPLSGLLRDYDWAQLRTVPILPGGWQGRYPDAVIPSLEQVLIELGSRTRWLIELKADPGGPPGLGEAVVRLLAGLDPAPHVRIISFDQGLLHAAATAWREFPERQRAPLGWISAAGQPGDLLEGARRTGAAALHLHHRLWTPELVEAAGAAGLITNAWTVNHPDTATRLATLGLDEITTDDPAGIRAHATVAEKRN